MKPAAQTDFSFLRLVADEANGVTVVADTHDLVELDGAREREVYARVPVKGWAEERCDRRLRDVVAEDGSPGS